MTQFIFPYCVSDNVEEKTPVTEVSRKETRGSGSYKLTSEDDAKDQHS